MNFCKFATDLLNARDYLKFSQNILFPDVIIFVDKDGTAVQMDNIEISINGNCIQFMVK